MALIVLQRLLKVRGICSVSGILRGCADHYDVLQRCNRPTITSSILMTNPGLVFFHNSYHSLTVVLPFECPPLKKNENRAYHNK